MGDQTGIEWTDATWNPVVGCSVISPGCTNCYAMKMAGRLEAMGSTIYKGHTVKTKAGFVWNGKVSESNWGQMIRPLLLKKPRRIFVNSMSDLFHNDMPEETIDRVFTVMALSPQHTFQVLTKRADRMLAYLTRKAGGEKQDVRNHIAWNTTGEILNAVAPQWKAEGVDGPWRSRGIKACTIWPLPNVWLGVSVEDQTRADERIPLLLETPAAKRFLSCEPLLGPVDLTKVREQIGAESFITFDALAHPDILNRGRCRQGIDWIIVGGESGKDARPMHPDWARSLRDQCEAAGVPFFFKQWGEWAPQGILKTGRHLQFPADIMDRIGKKAAGRLLDGREWNEVPE
jgi:protein gp37